MDNFDTDEYLLKKILAGDSILADIVDRFDESIFEDFPDDDDYFKEDTSLLKAKLKPKQISNADNIIKDNNPVNSWGWSVSSSQAYYITCYVMQKYLSSVKEDLLIDDNYGIAELDYTSDFEVKEKIYTHAKMHLLFDNSIFTFEFNANQRKITVTSHANILDLISKLDHEIKYNNPLRKKHIHLVPGGQDFDVLFKKPPTIGFDDLILDQKMKEDIFDNTVFQLTNTNENNGIILHGVPGTGKSLTCQAIINGALQEGYSTCFLTTQVDYTYLNEFIEKFLAPCVIIFEDIDAFCGSRETTSNEDISDFLQFLSGLSDREDQIIVVATTNYLEHLDEAVRNRPMRFNRKFKFELPNNDEINHLIDLYFKDNSISADMRKLCYNVQFSGSHIKEVHRSASLMAKKKSLTLEQCFASAVEMVKSNFPVSYTHESKQVSNVCATVK